MKDVQQALKGPPEHELSALAAHVAQRLQVPRIAPVQIAAALAAGDFLAFGLSLWFAAYAAVPIQTFQPIPAALAAIAGAGIAVLLTLWSGGYRLARLRKGGRSVGAALLALSAAAPVTLLLLPAGFGDWAAFAWALALGGASFAGLMRLAAARFSRWAIAAGVTARRAVIAGGGAEAERLVRGLAGRADNDIRVHAIFDDRGRERVPDRVLDVPLIGNFADLVTFCREAEIDLILLTLPPDAEARIAMLLNRFRVLPLPVHLTAFSQDFAFRDDAPALQRLLPATFLPERRLAKRVFDLVFGALALVLFAPVMLLVAIAIRLDSPGPVLFRQERHGFKDRRIAVWKFRTMFADQCDPRARQIVTRDDHRVTRVGRVLRKTSLDELPQLFNVLSGSLSLVGPRPHALEAQSSRQERFAEIVDGYSARHRLPPGITGWAQINGWRGEVRDPESLRARFDHDLYYIENWSLWLDLKILLRTPITLLDTRRAY